MGDKKIVIFGDGKIADVIQFYMREVSNWPVVAFTVDDKAYESEIFNGLPVIPYSELKETYTPEQINLFIAVGYHDLNKLRADKITQVEKDGYKVISYVHPDAGIPSDTQYGKNIFIMDRSLIHPRVSIGDDTFVWSGSVIGHHSKIGNHNWLTSGCNISGNVVLGDHNFLAINATISHSVTVGDECFLGANALITKDVNDKEVIIADNHKPIRLNSEQFLRFSGFKNV